MQINKNIRNKTLKKFKGGKVLSSGGFGCIFQPALKCKTAKNRKDDSVSKLMKKKYAVKEYDEIKRYLPLLEKIPNYKNYFLANDVSICDPDDLDDDDLENFDKKCSALTKNGFTKENINKNLDKLKLITLPYGGVDVGDFVEKSKINYKQMADLNKSLQLLLEKGILPMNKEGIYHCDIKDSNILVQETDNTLYTRLIDWGLSTSYKGLNKSVPSILLNRPFQFNVPFSNVIFNKIFTKMYGEFLKKNPDPDYISIRSFVINYTVVWIDERGPGHLRTLNGLLRDMFEDTIKNVDDKFKQEIIEYNYTFYFIFEYLTQVLLKFTKGSHFDEMKYFSEVFLKNIDIWGFIMTYIPIFEYLHKNYKKLNDTEIEIMKTIKDMIFLAFQSSAEPINIDKLDHLLTNLGALLEKVDKKASFSRLKRPSSSSSSSKKLSSQKGGTKRSLMKKGGSIIHYYHHLHQKRKSSKKHTLTMSSSKKESTYNNE